MSDSLPLIVCPECDFLQQTAVIPRGGKLCCVRCNASLRRWTAESLDRPVALALTALVCFVIANVYPVMTLEFQAQSQEATILQSVFTLHDEGETAVGVLVGITSILSPALLICSLLWLLLPLRFGRQAPGFAPLFRVLMYLTPWTMIEVLMLGLVVAFVKLQHLATTSVGIGLWAYGATMFLLTAMGTSLQGDHIWSQHERVVRARGQNGNDGDAQ